MKIIIIVAVFLFCIVGCFIVYNEQTRRIKRDLNSIEFTRIDKLKPNQLAKFIGKVTNVFKSLTSPLTNSQCIYYSFTIEEKKKSGKNEYWSVIYNDEVIQDFLIENNNELVYVAPSLKPKNFERYNSIYKTITLNSKQQNEEIEQLLQKYKIKANGIIGIGKTIKVTESIIKIGQQIIVAGFVKERVVSKPIKEHPYSRIMSLCSIGNQKIIITDDKE